MVVKRIYAELRCLSGDQDARGVYAIDEVLRGASMYRLWLAANRCSYNKCRHSESVEPPVLGTTAGVWRNQLLAH
jgi:hypothetical protein